MTLAQEAVLLRDYGELKGESYNASNANWDANKIQICYCRKSQAAGYLGIISIAMWFRRSYIQSKKSWVVLL